MGVPTKRQFTDEFKREAVALWQTSGRLQTEVAREIGIQPTMLRRWKEKIDAGGGVPQAAVVAGSPRPATLPSPADQASEIARLKRELERVKMERDVLKRAIGIFAEVPR
jgi:transposase